MTDTDYCKEDIFDESHLELLEKKTNNLSGFPEGDMVDTIVTSYSLENGESYAISLLNDDNVSVALWKNEKESIFPAHSHKEKEWLIVVRGIVSISVENETTYILKNSDSITIEPNTVHELYFIEDTDIVGITIPKSKEFPKGGISLW